MFFFTFFVLLLVLATVICGIGGLVCFVAGVGESDLAVFVFGIILLVVGCAGLAGVITISEKHDTPVTAEAP